MTLIVLAIWLGVSSCVAEPGPRSWVWRTPTYEIEFIVKDPKKPELARVEASVSGTNQGDVLVTRIAKTIVEQAALRRDLMINGLWVLALLGAALSLAWVFHSRLWRSF